MSGGTLALAHKEYHGACQLQQQIGCRTLEEMNKMQVVQEIAGAGNGALSQCVVLKRLPDSGM